MSKNNKLFLFIAIMACFGGMVQAQNTNSPYSRYGYGVLRDQVVGPSKGMGGIAYGVRNSLSANPSNPASYTRVDSLTFLFDIGISYNKSKLSDASGSQNDDNGGLDYITMLMPLSKRLGLSFGIIPFSSVGYSYGSLETAKNADGTDSGVTYLRSFAGSGGLSEVYAGVGYETPLKGLSVGANATYLFGSVDHSSAIPQTSVSTSYAIARSTSLSVHALKLDFGLQYEKTLSKKDVLTVGAVFAPPVKSTGKYEQYNTYYTSPVQRDTLVSRGEDAGLPMTLGLGFTLTRNQNITVGADVTYQKWSDVKYTTMMGDEMTDATRFNDRWKVAVGGEYMIDPYDRSYFKKIKFRGGVNYSNSYLNFKDKSTGETKGYNEYGATIGFGFPLRDRESYGNRTSYININFEYKKIKPELKSMITENYYGVSVNVNINEFWFFKKKVY